MNMKLRTIVEVFSPTQHKAIKALMDKVSEKYSHAKALSALDPMYIEGKAIMFNRQTPEHKDRQDPINSWALLLCLGSFATGGCLVIPKLKLRMRFLPGDVILLRGRVLEHYVEAWGTGQRISIAHFTHESLWKEFDMTCPL
jgi:hypothetical protein